MTSGNRLEIRPVTAGRWDDLVELFGERGAYANCWCMWWRVSGSDFDRGIRKRGGGNRRALKGLVAEGRVPGLLAYRNGRPVGWVSVAPREEFGRLQRSPTLKPLDDQPVWSIVCFFMDRGERGQGVGTALLEAAVRHAAERGATIVEGYPVDPADRPISNADAYTGVVSMFRRAGFREVARRGSRPIMRRKLRRRR
ncbi:MAG TPA: GNAT family N-acetyltransferase [Actinomycetota bacterium]|nr:GNAT family N-acetyltransferase [Actinomycetota bacterium]